MERKEDRPARPVPVRGADRLAKEAEALRANLRKRKDQARLREDRKDRPADPGEPRSM